MPLRVGAQELSGKAPKCHALTIIESSYFLVDFSITKQTIVAISQRTHIIISAKPKLPSVTDLLYLQRYRS